MRRFNLRSLSFGSDEAERRVFCEVAPFSLGGLEYEVAGGGVELDLRARRVGRRLTLRGDGVAAIRGPCQRCLSRRRSTCRWPASSTSPTASPVVDDDEPYARGYV